jgi:hypothetical protein
MRRILALVALLIGLTAAGTAQAQNRFWLENQSGITIREAYVSASRVDFWGPDILGASVLPPGQRVWVTPAFGDCVLDVRVVYMDGRAEERRNVNACGCRASCSAAARGPAPSSAAATRPSPCGTARAS